MIPCKKCGQPTERIWVQVRNYGQRATGTHSELARECSSCGHKQWIEPLPGCQYESCDEKYCAGMYGCGV